MGNSSKLILCIVFGLGSRICVCISDCLSVSADSTVNRASVRQFQRTKYLHVYLFLYCVYASASVIVFAFAMALLCQLKAQYMGNQHPAALSYLKKESEVLCMCNSNIFVFVSLSMFVFVSVFIYVFTTQLYQLTAQFGASAPLAALTSLKESNVSCMCLCMCLCLYWYMSLYLYICPAAVSSADSAVWDIRASRRFNFTVLSRSSHKQSSQVGRVHVYCVFVFVLYPFLSLHSPYCIS